MIYEFWYFRDNCHLKVIYKMNDFEKNRNNVYHMTTFTTTIISTANVTIWPPTTQDLTHVHYLIIPSWLPQEIFHGGIQQWCLCTQIMKDGESNLSPRCEEWVNLVPAISRLGTTQMDFTHCSHVGSWALTFHVMSKSLMTSLPHHLLCYEAML